MRSENRCTRLAPTFDETSPPARKVGIVCGQRGVTLNRLPDDCHPAKESRHRQPNGSGPEVFPLECQTSACGNRRLDTETPRGYAGSLQASHLRPIVKHSTGMPADSAGCSTARSLTSHRSPLAVSENLIGVDRYNPLKISTFLRHLMSPRSINQVIDATASL
jgi:hypothetical protein